MLFLNCYVKTNKVVVKNAPCVLWLNISYTNLNVHLLYAPKSHEKGALL